MKLFGNKKRPAPVKKDKISPEEPIAPEEPQEEEEGKLQPRTRAVFLMLGAICLFACSIVMCFMLIKQSAEVSAAPTEEPKEIRYEVNVVPPSTEETQQATEPVALEAPVSAYDADRLNFLLIGIDDATDLTNLIMLASVDLNTKEVALLSIPRETYISGNFKYPALFNVYKEAEGGEHGIKSVIEKVKEMIGFWPDYYFVLNSKSLNGLLDLTGNIEFEVPDTPAYSDLPGGKQSINGTRAIKLLNYRNDYYEISTEPAFVQRRFVQKLLTTLLEKDEKIDEYARSIAAFADTDLSSDNLAFLGHLLQGMDMDGIYSRALPGEAVEAGGASFYQVDPNEAAAMLNDRFNPLDEELTIYDLNFRQVTGDSGEGEYAPYGFGNGKNNTNNNNDDDNNDDNGGGETEETEATEETEPPEVTEEEVTETPDETETP